MQYQNDEIRIKLGQSIYHKNSIANFQFLVEFIQIK